MKIDEGGGSLLDSVNNIRLRLSYCGHAVSGSEWRGNAVSPPFARLYYILGGDPYITFTPVGEDGVHGAERVNLEPGKLYLLPTGFSFRYACESRMEQLFFHINLTDCGGSDLLRRCPGLMEYTPLPETAARLLTCVGQSGLCGGLQLVQELNGVLLALFERYGFGLQPARYSPCVLLAIEYIRAHLTLRLGVRELAAHAFVSESTLSKRFRAETGLSIGRFVDNEVLYEGAQLLTHTGLSIRQISERLGFCDQFYFSRRFKAAFGETPLRYRKQRPI